MELSDMKIAICDDDAADLGRVRGIIEKWGGGRIGVYAYMTPGELIEGLHREGHFDFYILDVIMPDMDGIELGRKLREAGARGRVIYLTTSAEYAVQSYSVRAYYYLMKPVSEEALMPLLDELAGSARERAATPICVHTHDEDILLAVGDIQYVYLSMRFPHFVTKDGEYVGMMLRRPFKAEMGELLSDRRFELCGASFCVNLAMIRLVNKHGAVFFSGRELDLPRASIPVLRKRWMDYWLEGDRH